MNLTAGQSLNRISQDQKQGLATQKKTVASQPNSLIGLSQMCFYFRAKHDYARFPVWKQ